MTGLVHLLFLSMPRIGGVCNYVISWYDWSCASALSLYAKGRWSLWLCHLLVWLVLCICSFSQCQGLVESVIVSSPGMTGLVHLLFPSMPRVGGVCDCVIPWYDWSYASDLSINTKGRWSLWLCHLLVWLVYFPSGLVRGIQLDESISTFRGVCCTFSFFLYSRCKFL